MASSEVIKCSTFIGLDIWAIIMRKFTNFILQLVRPINFAVFIRVNCCRFMD